MGKYHYNGKGIAGFLNSYASDKQPFISDISLQFPETRELKKEVMLLRKLFSPNYWNACSITKVENRTLLKTKLNELGQLFFKGIEVDIQSISLENKTKKSVNPKDLVDIILDSLPNIREKLKKDVEAAYYGDPAAKTYTEIIRCYPGFEAITVHRVVHLLYSLGIQYYARELSEYIHAKTGIDIHPGAKIGNYFFIDHGTGVVIGETAEIGNWVRIYQGVTLGFLHFERDGGVLKKGYKRHPTVGNHVVIGAGAKILGPINIGDHVNIGANSWITEDIQDSTTVFVAEHPRLEKRKINLKSS